MEFVENFLTARPQNVWLVWVRPYLIAVRTEEGFALNISYEKSGSSAQT